MFGFLAQLLAWCYDVLPSYAGAITLMTLIVMVAITPLTIKGMRSMAEMARLQPEMKKIQDQYKNDRVKQNEELQALFKEHGTSPFGGCLPNLLPFPVLIVIFRLLEGLTHKANHGLFSAQRVLNGLPEPKYLTHNNTLYRHLVADRGHMFSFGMDLAKSARDPHGTFLGAVPFYALIAIMTLSQYAQQRQINQRNPQAADANPQMKLTMQLMPAIYAVISLSLPASVVLYLLVSGFFRMAQQTLSYRFDPKLKVSLAEARAATAAKGSARTTTSSVVASGASGGASGGPAAPRPKGGWLTAAREAAAARIAPPTAAPADKDADPGNGAAPARESRDAKARREDAPEPERSRDRRDRPSPVNARPPKGSGRVTPRGTAPKGRRGR